MNKNAYKDTFMERILKFVIDALFLFLRSGSLFLTINHIEKRIRDHDKPQDVSLSNCLGFIYMWQMLIIRLLHAINVDICKNNYMESAT